MNVIAFGLNCASPEDMMASFECIFMKNDTEVKVFYCVIAVRKMSFQLYIRIYVLTYTHICI